MIEEKGVRIVNITEPPLARFLFADTRFAPVWLVLRILVGWQWLAAGWGKFMDPAWIGPHAGDGLTTFLRGSLWGAAGTQNVVSPGYWVFINNIALPHAALFSTLVTYGEMAVGIALIAGAFTGVAACAGAVLNFTYLLAGVVSVDPLFIIAELLLALGWRTAGWWGLDQWLLPTLGVPWQPGTLFRHHASEHTT